MQSPRRVAAVVLVAALAAGAVAVVTATTAPAPAERTTTPSPTVTALSESSPEATTRVRLLPARTELGSGDRVGGVSTPTTRVGPAVAVGDDELRARVDRYRALEALVTAETDTQRRAAVRTALNETRDAVERLRERERSAATAYHEGTIDRETLFRHLAAVHLGAAEHQRLLAELERRAGDAFTFEMRTRASLLSRELDMFRSSVRDRVAAGLTGETVPAVGVHTTASGLAVETVDGGEYVRDVVRFDRYGSGEGQSLNTTADVVDRLRTVYPEAFSASSGHSIASAGDRLFRAQFSHPQGRVQTFLNRDTGAVYREVQRLRLDRVETTVVANRTVGGVEVTVERTATGDPTLVRVERDATSLGTPDPVGGVVAVGNRTVGTTDDGRLWLLVGSTPVTVTVQTPDGDVTVSVEGASGDATRSRPVTVRPSP